MKKNFFRLAIVAAALAVVAACNQEDSTSEYGEVKAIEATAQTPEEVSGFETTRTVVVEKNNEFSLWWAAGESIGVPQFDPIFLLLRFYIFQNRSYCFLL